MPTWNEINAEIDALSATSGLSIDKACDDIRKIYLQKLAARTGTPAIAYYSGFLQKRTPDGRVHPECAINDHDMNGLMAVVHGLDRTKGLDLLLHTPGGDIEATRAFVEYLYQMFGRRLRVIVPHIAMSAGTMIACASNEVVMGKHSCLGPTDPHINGLATMGILAEVDRAIQEIQKEPLKQILWQQVFSKYPPAFISNCERAIDGARTMVRDWLAKGMLCNEADPDVAATNAIDQLMDYSGTTGHNHHFMADRCRAIGLNIKSLEDDQDLQEDVLSVHHSFLASFSRTSAIKFIENSAGGSWVVNA